MSARLYILIHTAFPEVLLSRSDRISTVPLSHPDRFDWRLSKVDQAPMSRLTSKWSRRGNLPVPSCRRRRCSFGALARQRMTLDNDKIDRAILALLYLGLHDVDRAWKGFDWEA